MVGAPLFWENLLSPRRRQEILYIHDFTSKWGKGDALRKIVKQSQGGAGRRGFFVINNAWATNLGDKSCMKMTTTQLDQKL